MNTILAYGSLHEFVILFKRILQATDGSKEHIANFFNYYYAQQINYSVRLRFSEEEYDAIRKAIKEAILERENSENLILGLSDLAMKASMTPRSKFMINIVPEYVRDIL